MFVLDFFSVCEKTNCSKKETLRVYKLNWQTLTVKLKIVKNRCKLSKQMKFGAKSVFMFCQTLHSLPIEHGQKRRTSCPKPMQSVLGFLWRANSYSRLFTKRKTFTLLPTWSSKCSTIYNQINPLLTYSCVMISYKHYFIRGAQLMLL